MLVAILCVPLGVAIVAALLPARLGAPLSVLGALATLGLTIVLVIGFDTGVPGLQYVVDESWIPGLGVRFQLGVDGISLFLLVMTALLWAATLVWSAWRLPDRPKNYFLMLGIGEFAVMGAFCAQDLLLFVLFFDLMLVPFFFLVGSYGTGDRVRATIKMMVYTLVGSLLMLVAAIATAVLTAENTGDLSFAMADLRANVLPEGSQEWIFLFFAAAFLVKMPSFPVHGWMPDAYRAAPLPVLALLSGVLPKVAAYGFLRVALPIFPDATVEFQELILVLALVSIIYGSMMAFTQTNVRLIAGYSSIAQLGFITLGIFSLTAGGANGSVLQMVNHGLVVAPIFLIIAILSRRYGTEDLREMGGAATRAPVLAVAFLIVTMATLAMPGSANFIGEFYILNGLFDEQTAYAVIATAGIAMAAFYALRLYQKTMHNRLPEGVVSSEMSIREASVLVPLVLVIVGIALYPTLILQRGEASVQDKVGAVTSAQEESELAARP
jgi:NADH-quinone oxidoreductase subunit M